MRTLVHGYNRYCRGCRCDVCKEAKAGYQREYRRKNHAQEREWQNKSGRQYRVRHPDRLKMSRRKWLQTPAGSASNRNGVLRYRGRQRNAPGMPSDEALLARIAYYGFRCWMCRAPYEAIDHVLPLSRGGTNWPSNLRPACKSCNSRKGDRDWRMFTNMVLFGPRDDPSTERCRSMGLGNPR